MTSISEPVLTLPSEEFIRTALKQANPNVLRIALYHQTQDPELTDIPVSTYKLRGGALAIPVIPREVHEKIRDKAFAYLSGGTVPKPNPDLDETRNLLEIYSGNKPSESELHWAFEELGFDDFPRSADWSSPPSKDKLRNNSVTIIGSGFSGLAMAVQLEHLGIPYRILERRSSLGGTWFLNDYPEARVDVPSFSYQYKFEKDYPWKSYFAPQPELLEYAEHIADKYGIKQHIRFNTHLESARWDEIEKVWHLQIAEDDGVETLTSRFVISASGLFSTPKLPDIPGIDSFQGKMFHTTDWDHSYDLRNKRIALIGTGSTGTQLARSLAKDAKRLTVFQRSANWVTPIQGYHAQIGEELQWLMRAMPGYRAWFTYLNASAEYAGQDLHELDQEWIDNGGKINAANQNLREVLTDFIREKTQSKPELFEQCLPDHSPMSRRLVIDNEWYDTLVRDNVDLVSGGIQQITGDSLIDDQGHSHPADLIVLSAGFTVQNYLWPVSFTGRDGVSLESLWAKDGARAFKGLTMPDFPNLFVIYGPNAQARAGSFHSVVEALSRYIGQMLVHAIESDQPCIEVKQQRFLDYNQALNAAHKKLIWEHEQGGGGYYVNEHGRSAVLMPWRWHDFYQMIRTPDFENYRFS